MPRYVAELYLSHVGSEGLRDAATRARAAADELNREGAPIRYLRAMFLGEDETCFHLYEADTAELVREASSRARIPVERIVETIDIEPEGNDTD